MNIMTSIALWILPNLPQSYLVAVYRQDKITDEMELLLSPTKEIVKGESRSELMDELFNLSDKISHLSGYIYFIEVMFVCFNINKCPKLGRHCANCESRKGKLLRYILVADGSAKRFCVPKVEDRKPEILVF